MNDLEADLLIANAKIKQLQEQLAAERAKYAELQRYNVDCTKQCGMLQMDKVNLQTLLSTSQRREQAAVGDLKISAYCRTCSKKCGLFEALSKRDNEGGCKDFEWRGPQEAGKGQSDGAE